MDSPLTLSPDPAVVERKMYLTMLGIPDDPKISTADLRDRTAGGAQVKNSVEIGGLDLGKLYDSILLMTRTRISPVDKGAVGDGVTIDTPALTQAISDAATYNLPVEFNGNYKIDSDLTINSRSTITGPTTFRADTDPVTGTPSVTVTITRWMDLTDVRFIGVILKMAPSVFGLTRVIGATFRDARLVMGETDKPARAVEVRSCDFTATLSRTFDAITLNNVSDADIQKNRISDYRYGVYQAATVSFANRKVLIERNNISNCSLSVYASGSSLARISGLTIRKNTFVVGSRDTSTTGANCIRLWYCAKVDIDDNTLYSQGTAIRIEASIDGVIRNNRINAGLATSHRIGGFGNAGWRIINNTIASKTGGYALLWTSGNFGTVANNPYLTPQDLLVSGNKFGIANLGLKIENTVGAQVIDNDFLATGVPGSGNGFIWFAGTTTGRYFGNRLSASSGTTVVVAGTASATSSEPQTLVVATAPTKTVNAPIITASDPDLNGAKSYVVTFTLSDVSLLHHMIDDDNFKTLSEWMATATAPTLGWNASAWELNVLNVGDVLTDGNVYDNSGVEYWWSMKSAVVIDRFNKLTTRNWWRLPTDTTHPDHIASAMAEESVYIAATFRPPLIVDGAKYDAVASGIVTQTSYAVQLSGRMSIGQKADGTYVLVAVDGKTDSYGCTEEQVANKHLALGSMNAFNLDSGGSTTLWYSGTVINSPSDSTGERKLPSVMYV